MAIITFTNGTLIKSSEVNNNFASVEEYVDSIPADDTTSPSGIITIPADTIRNGVKVTFDYGFSGTDMDSEGHAEATILVKADGTATPVTTKRTIDEIRIYGPGSNDNFWTQATGTCTTLIEDLTTTVENYVQITWSTAGVNVTETLTISNIMVTVY